MSQGEIEALWMYYIFVVVSSIVGILKCILFWKSAKLGIFLIGFEINDALSQKCSWFQKHQENKWWEMDTTANM